MEPRATPYGNSQMRGTLYERLERGNTYDNQKGSNYFKRPSNQGY